MAAPVFSSESSLITARITSELRASLTHDYEIDVAVQPHPGDAWSRLAKIRNAPGATTKLRNTSLPSHKLKPRNSIVRRKIAMLGF